MEKLRDYLTKEGWKRDWDKSSDLAKGICKTVAFPFAMPSIVNLGETNFCAENTNNPGFKDYKGRETEDAVIASLLGVSLTGLGAGLASGVDALDPSQALVLALTAAITNYISAENENNKFQDLRREYGRNLLKNFVYF